MITIYNSPQVTQLFYAHSLPFFYKKKMRPLSDDQFVACFEENPSADIIDISEREIKVKIAGGFEKISLALDINSCLDEWDVPNGTWYPLSYKEFSPSKGEIYLYKNGEIYLVKGSASAFFLNGAIPSVNEIYTVIPEQFFDLFKEWLKKEDVEIMVEKGMVYLRSDSEIVKFPESINPRKDYSPFNRFIPEGDKWSDNEGLIEFLQAAKSNKLPKVKKDGDKLVAFSDGSVTINTKAPSFFTRGREMIVPDIKGTSKQMVVLLDAVLVTKLNGSFGVYQI